MAKRPINAKKVKGDGRTDETTDGRRDGPTNRGVESRSTRKKPAHSFQLRTRNFIGGFVRRSVRRSVGPSVGPWTRVEKWENKRSRTFLVADSCISAPVHPSATDGRVSGLVYHEQANKKTERPMDKPTDRPTGGTNLPKEQRCLDVADANIGNSMPFFFLQDALKQGRDSAASQTIFFLLNPFHIKQGFR